MARCPIPKPMHFAVRRQGPAQLYPMTGLYLLHAPTKTPYIGFFQAFAGPNVLVLADSENALIVPIVGRVGRVLQNQIERQPAQTRYIALLTAPRFDNQSLDEVSVARLRPLNDIDQWFGRGAAQWVRQHRNLAR